MKNNPLQAARKIYFEFGIAVRRTTFLQKRRTMVDEEQATDPSLQKEVLTSEGLQKFTSARIDLIRAISRRITGSRGSSGSSLDLSIESSVYDDFSADEDDHHTKKKTSRNRACAWQQSFWTRLAKNSDIWEELDKDEEREVPSMKVVARQKWDETKYMARRDWMVVRQHPSICFISMAMFIIMCGPGIALVLIFGAKAEEDFKQNALELATETGEWFSSQLDLAILPLFSMAQFIHELDIFQDLPIHIGPGGEPGSLPYLPPKSLGGSVTHRNVTGVCDKPDLVKRFNEIASTIKKNAGMEGVLVNIQALPYAVNCLLYPLNNTEDFEDGIFMDNTGAQGHDLAKDPDRVVLAEKTLASENVVIAGPLPLRQCQECHPTVEKAFIARLPITMEGHDIEVNGNVYKKKWGFSVVLINWKELVERSGIYETFDSKGSQFRLTRTDKKYDTDKEEYSQEVVVLAETPNFDTIEMDRFVTTKLQTTDNEWEITVSYFHPDKFWKPWAFAAVVLASTLISFLITVVLIEKQINHNLLNELIPSKALKKIKRGELVIEKFDVVTIFFADIVGYTSMSAQMRPLAVMRMLNDFFSGMDMLAKKHGVFKMETIGDAYLVAGGLPDRFLGEEGAEKVALFALEAVEFAERFVASDGSKVSIRAGISSGPAVAGVVGSVRPKYTVFGDTINTASRMESTSMTNKIQCSDTTYRLLRDAPTHTFDLEPRGLVDIKGKGKMPTWWITHAQRIESSNTMEISGETLPSWSSKEARKWFFK